MAKRNSGTNTFIRDPPLAPGFVHVLGPLIVRMMPESEKMKITCTTASARSA
ncbi:MAG: hypothetical protein IPK99_06920 [Flavobacteriales bacterium]|nr:hypothetical protein [Flavobacteriales bacterium]